MHEYGNVPVPHPSTSLGMTLSLAEGQVLVRSERSGDVGQGGFVTVTASRSTKVLVVDDHPETLEVLEFVLQLAGFEVTARADGLGALGTRLDEFDAVVTDLAMPRMDGAELVRALRARMQRPVPIVVLTGQGIPFDCLDCRCCVLLRKPSMPDDVTATLRWLVESCVHECDNCAIRRMAAPPPLDVT